MIWGSTDMVLDTLKRRGVHATFFVIGIYAKQHPRLLHRILQEGHTLGR